MKPTADQQHMELTVGSLVLGKVYRFFIVAVNSKGKSPSSPILSVVAGDVAGVGAYYSLVYATVAPTITSISSTLMAVTIPKAVVGSTGAIPITGYKLYMYPGVSVSTTNIPVTITNEIQVIKTSVKKQIFEVQKIVLMDVSAKSTFALSFNGVLGSNLTTSSSANDIKKSLTSIFSSSTSFMSINPTVSSWKHAGSNYSFEITFTDYDGPTEMISVRVVDPNTVTATVELIAKGTLPISGTFTVLYGNHMTVDLASNATADEVKYSLQDLPGVGVVSIEKSSNYISGKDRGAYTWTVTFHSAGNHPLLGVTAGRLSQSSRVHPSSHMCIKKRQSRCWCTMDRGLLMSPL